MSFSTLGLSDRITRGVDASGYTTPTPIQSLAIPVILTGRDIVGCAQTGTGKTAAFVLPLLDRLSQSRRQKGSTSVRALVLTPTRELALQVQESVTTYGQFTNISSAAVFGGVNMDNQIKRLQRGVDVVVATPGRLLDHIGRKTVDLSKVEVLILDEADRMFDMGFINDVRKIIGQIPADRQTLMFSATMSQEIRKLIQSVQKDPEFVEIGHRTTPADTVSQDFYGVRRERKMDLLYHLLKTEKMESVLIFSRTKHNADKISKKLTQAGFDSAAIHSNRSQSQRQRTLAGFKEGRHRILVATDIAARGIDVDGISHVINYDTPVFAEDYIHRIGRTGRAEAVGAAITFVSDAEMDALKRIERFVGKKYQLRSTHHIAPSAGDAPPVSKAVSNVRKERGQRGTGRNAGRPQQKRREPSAFKRNGKRKPAQPVTPAQDTVVDADWRKLMETADKGSMGERIAKFFRS